MTYFEERYDKKKRKSLIENIAFDKLDITQYINCLHPRPYSNRKEFMDRFIEAILE
ncbi:MAG: hypothetical protein NTX49_06155 [Chlamydiae bacterium]|nr:hypothetical protein [Chlamydiota bacterium]